MEAITALALCILLVPVVAVIGWFVFENHDRFVFQLHRPERRGFEVIMRHRGYSFTEVMFAVVVLGVGFMMIAAMFPVAMSQQQSTQDETNASAIARGAMVQIELVARTTRNAGTGLPEPDGLQNVPTTDVTVGQPAYMMPFDKLTNSPAAMAKHGMFSAFNGALVYTANPRYAFIPFYRREAGSRTLHVVVIVTKVRDRSRYDDKDYTIPATGTKRPNFMPRPVTITVTQKVGGTNTNWITFAGPFVGAVNEGAYVVVSNSPAAGSTPAGAFNGRVYRVGMKATDIGATVAPPDTWELAPGNDYQTLAGPDGLLNTPDDYAMPNNTVAYIVGRATDPPDSTNYTDLAQDVAAYTSFVEVK